MTLIEQVFKGTLKDFEIPGFLIGRDRRRYLDFFNVYAQSEHGRHHAQQPLRYVSAFGDYGRRPMLRDQGPDIHPLGHMPATERTFVALMRQQPRSSVLDVHVGRLASLVHDMGECTHPGLMSECGAVVGDIPQGRKTPEQRATESRIWDTLFSCYYPDLADAYKLRIRDVVMHQESDGSGLQSAVEAAHDANTFKAGLWAGQLALTAMREGRTTDKRFVWLSEVGKVVTRESIPRVEEQARSFAFSDRLLGTAAPLYERIQTRL